jgi:hypothetical protein
MSDHAIPFDGVNLEGDAGLLALVTGELRAPDTVAVQPPNVIYRFTPDLTTEEQATFAELVRFARSGIDGITFAEWQGLRDDLNGLRQYHGLASPNLSQTALATKALIRVVGAILRDSP